MADYGRITQIGGVNYFLDNKGNKTRANLRQWDTGIDAKGNRNMWDGSKWVPIAEVTTNKVNKKKVGNFTYYNDGKKGYWRRADGSKMVNGNRIKFGEGNYKQFNSDGSITDIMVNGKFTDFGNKLSDEEKQHMSSGHVYDKAISDVNGQVYSRARSIRTDQGKHDLANNTYTGWREDLDFNTDQKSYKEGVSYDKKREEANKKAIEFTKSYKPQPSNWLQNATANFQGERNRSIMLENYEKNPTQDLSEEQKVELEKAQAEKARRQSMYDASDKLALVGAGSMVAAGTAPAWLPMATEIITHPIQNIVAPQIASKGVNEVLDTFTNWSPKTKEIISTGIGFALGQGAVGWGKNKISRELLKRGYGSAFESGSQNMGSKFLQNQLETKWTSFGSSFRNPGKQATEELTKKALRHAKTQGALTQGTANFMNYGAPSLFPAAGQLTSYLTTDKTMGENLSDMSQGMINPIVGDFITEGILGASGQHYGTGQAYTQSSMSGGKKGFKENWKFFWNNAGRTAEDPNFTKKHPVLGRALAIGRFITNNSGNNNYQMSTLAGTHTGADITHYVPYNNGEQSDLKLVKYWFSGNSDDLGRTLKEEGQFMLGNKDTSTGNIFEKIAKGLGGNDGRFESGQIAKVIAPNDGGYTEKVLSKAKFLNMRTKQQEPLFLESGELNPNVKFGAIPSRSNVLLDAQASNGGYKGTMLDIDGHLEVPVFDESGKYLTLNIDTPGPGSGSQEFYTKGLSRAVSHNQKPFFTIALSGNKEIGEASSKLGTSKVFKNMLPVEAATTDRKFKITYENMDSPNVKAMFGDTPEYKTLSKAREEGRKKVRETNTKLKELKNRNFSDDFKKSLRSSSKSAETRLNKFKKELEITQDEKTQKSLQKSIEKAEERIANLEKVTRYVESGSQKPWILRFFNPDRKAFNNYLEKRQVSEPTHRGVEIAFKQGGKLTQIQKFKNIGITKPTLDWEEYQKQNRK